MSLGLENAGVRLSDQSVLPVLNFGTGILAKSIDLGNYRGCAALNNNTAKCWGNNDQGELELGAITTTKSMSQTSTINLGDGLVIDKIYSGKSASSLFESFTCAIVTDGVSDSLKCWGANTNGERGIGSTVNQNTPQSVSLGAGLIPFSVTVGVNHTCVTLTDNSVKCWGLNTSGQLGDGTTVQKGHNGSTTPNNIAALSLGGTVNFMALGSAHSCALLSNNTLKCWGDNVNGQLGVVKTTTSSNTPLTITVPGQAPKLVMASGKRTCVMTIKNEIECVGLNTSGELGIGTTATDKALYTGTGISLGPNSLSKYFTMGESHSCIITVPDRLKCIGLGASGQLGVNSTINRGSSAATLGENLYQISATAYP